MGLNSICAHAMEMGKFFPSPLFWCKSCDIIIKIEGKNINYILWTLHLCSCASIQWRTRFLF